MDAISFLTEYRYAFIFIGMFVLGEAVLIPALYLSFQGVFDPLNVFFVSISATLLSDAMWYLIGRYLSTKDISESRLIQNRKEVFDKTTRLYDTYGLRILYLSKFIYGTRTIVQIITGYRKIPHRDYVVVNTLGALTYLFSFFLIASLMHASFDEFGALLNEVKIAILFIIIILVSVNIWVQQLAKRKSFLS
ncbi:VTT domain-containing protein [Candidatus Parcubacteria bacterium]|nr:VTT domain-containing protein [Candidatus Parcubacteria bacterium]